MINEKDIVISVKNITKDYGDGRGIFDVSFDVPRCSVFGYCGTNGSGKTTTLRHIMGFLKPESGSVTVNGLDAWKNSQEIKKMVGYLPGEIAFPPVESGSAFLKIQAEMLGMSDMSKAERIINMMQLDPTANLKRMSKGMKQKTAIVAAFMNSPEIIILDEPTTGLDPLMREAFIEIIKEEKERGATIVMSNHMFDELEETCDYVAFIKDGHIVDIVNMDLIHKRSFREFVVRFKSKEQYEKFVSKKFEVILEDKKNNTLKFKVNNDDSEAFAKELAKYEIESLTEDKFTLEKYFMQNVANIEVNKK